MQVQIKMVLLMKLQKHQSSKTLKSTFSPHQAPSVHLCHISDHENQEQFSMLPRLQRDEFRHFGVRTCVVWPGPFQTAFYNQGGTSDIVIPDYEELRKTLAKRVMPWT